MGTQQSLPAASAQPQSSAAPRDLTGQITVYKNNPAACGGFADVLRGKWKGDAIEIEVAIKVLRLYSITDDQKKEKILKRLRRELRIWERCDHQNILPFFGVTFGFGPWQSMVCQWMERGNVTDYLEQFNFTLHIADRLRLVLDVLAGLDYLHSLSIVHGDLTGANVLIDHDNRARLSDFGLSQVITEIEGSSYFTSTVSGAYRWTAPELYGYDDEDVVVVTMACDMYSFGSIMLQILSGKVPYYYLKKEVTVLLYVKDGRKPKRPTEIAIEVHWDLIGRCWAEAAERPTARSLLQDVRRLVSEAEQVRHLEEEQNKQEQEEQRRKDEEEQKRRQEELKRKAVVPLRFSSTTKPVIKGFRPRVSRALSPASSSSVMPINIPSNFSPTQEVESTQGIVNGIKKGADDSKRIETQRHVNGSAAPATPSIPTGKGSFRSRMGRAMRSSSFSAISRPRTPSLSRSYSQDVSQSPAGPTLPSKSYEMRGRIDERDERRQGEEKRTKSVESLRMSPLTTTGMGRWSRVGTVVRRSSSSKLSPNATVAEDGKLTPHDPSPTTPGFKNFRSRVGGVLRKKSSASSIMSLTLRHTPSPCPSLGQDVGEYMFEAEAACQPNDTMIDPSCLNSPTNLETKGFRSRVGRRMRKRSNISAGARSRASSFT